MVKEMTSDDLRRFSDRPSLVSALHALLPWTVDDATTSPTRGGRSTALHVLERIRPQAYRETRNFLAGDVSRLSAYLRHGVLTLAEVRDSALAQVSEPEEAGKFINELAWRDYWQRLYELLGEQVWQDQEHYKTGLASEQYANALPADIPDAGTTLACMDAFAKELQEAGYLHNHARLWFAAYIVHWRRTEWQAGARWFLEHLIDGDPASNNLSWQWVASTFASAPYIFNRDNLERYTEGAYCRSCPHADAGTCPFDHNYDELEAKLFPRMDRYAGEPMTRNRYISHNDESVTARPEGKPLLWHHTDGLNPEPPLSLQHPDAPAVFIWDTGWLVPNRISLKRIVFIAECLVEMPGHVEMRVGEPAEQLLAAARSAQVDYVLAQRTPDPRLKAAALQVARHIPVVWVDPPAFVDISRGVDMKRFSRYWKRAQSSAMKATQG